MGSDRPGCEARLQARSRNGRPGWLAASRATDGTRQQTRLGRADDVAVADGVAVLNHEHAKMAARSWAKSIKAGERKTAALTVNDVLDQYFEARQHEGMKSINEARRASSRSRRQTAAFSDEARRSALQLGLTVSDP